MNMMKKIFEYNLRSYNTRGYNNIIINNFKILCQYYVSFITIYYINYSIIIHHYIIN